MGSGEGEGEVDGAGCASCALSSSCRPSMTSSAAPLGSGISRSSRRISATDGPGPVSSPSSASRYTDALCSFEFRSSDSTPRLCRDLRAERAERELRGEMGAAGSRTVSCADGSGSVVAAFAEGVDDCERSGAAGCWNVGVGAGAGTAKRAAAGSSPPPPPASGTSRARSA